MASVHFG